MKILIVSNLYPPHYFGGYEIRCAQVAEALHQRGHEVEVVTSTYGLNGGTRREVCEGVVVHRCLHQEFLPPFRTLRPWTFFQARAELADARRLHRIAKAFKPELINLWNLQGLSSALLPLPRMWGIPDVHWIEHWWMIDQYGKIGEVVKEFWASIWDGTWGPSRTQGALRALGRIWEARTRGAGLATRDFSMTPAHVVFVSRFMAQMHRDAGLVFASSEVIHGGVPVDRFFQAVNPLSVTEPIRLLYAGQLTADRGLHTVIDALARLEPGLRSCLRLDVVGQGHPEYEVTVKEQVMALGLSACVSFAGRIRHDRMASMYREHDLLVFPSTRPEGLPLTMIEAMLAGCAVITTGAGGARDIADLAELPTFPPGNPEALAALLARLLADRAEITRIAARGQQVARVEFGFDLMVDRFVATLNRLPKQRSV